MSDSGTDLVREQAGDTGMALVIYILYLVGLVFGITFLVGVIMAYVNRGDAPDWLESHYTFQIRTFWIGLLLTVIGTLLALVVIGYLVLLFAVIWLIIRCAKGISLLNRRRQVFHAETWMFP